MHDAILCMMQYYALYIALNWSERKCRNSELRKHLPVRRKRKGRRPGITGSGPMKKEIVEDDQWAFPDTELEEEIRRKIVATVVEIVTEVMFTSHLYTFGGKIYKQEDGGPTGLRGTCCIACLAMCMWDRAWQGRLLEVGILFHLYAIYMDDGRIYLQPLRKGWRWNFQSNCLEYCQAWEMEDDTLSVEEITRRALAGTMAGLVSCLKSSQLNYAHILRGGSTHLGP